MKICIQVNKGSVSVPMHNYVGLPAGGSFPQVLTKMSDQPFDAAWLDPTGGGSGGDTVTRIASGNLNGHRIVYADSQSTVAFADASSYSQCRRVIGMTTGAANDGEPATVQFQNLINEPGWSWTTGADIYLTSNGMITETVPTSGNLMQIGVAVSPTAINLNFNFIAKIS